MAKIHAYKSWNLFRTIRNYNVVDLIKNKEKIISRLYSIKKHTSRIKLDRIIEKMKKRNRIGNGLTGEKLINSTIFRTAIKYLEIKNKEVKLSNILDVMIQIKEKIGESEREFNLNDFYY